MVAHKFPHFLMLVDVSCLFRFSTTNLHDNENAGFSTHPIDVIITAKYF